MTRDISVIPYQKDWADQYSSEAQWLKQVIGNHLVDIHHVGSTSIPGLAAKPIIDIIPVVKNILEMDNLKKLFEQRGYEIMGELGIPFRRFYKKVGANSFNVHVYQQGSAEVDRLLLFKAYLINHPVEIQTYATLKEKLAAEFQNDIYNYCMGKTQFIERIDSLSGYTGKRMVEVLTEDEKNAFENIKTKEVYQLLNFPLKPTEFEKPGHTYFIFRNINEFVGAGEVEFLNTQKVALRLLAISTAHQNQGLGKYFLELIEKWVKTKGYNEILLHTYQPVKEFYLKCGYQSTMFDEPEKKKGINFKIYDLVKFI